MTRTYSLLTGVTFAALLCSPLPAFSQTAPNLGSSQRFAVLGGSAVTVAGAAVTPISGDVGSSPTPSITGFPPGQVTPPFNLYTTNAAPVQDAQGVNTAAYLNLVGQGCTSIILGGTLGGLVLGPGVHCVVGVVADLTGTLTLSGGGVYIFKATSSLVTAGASNVALINGANSCDVYWQVTSSATLGSASTFRGSIFALTSISIGTTANVVGRTWAQNGAVTMDGGNSVGGCSSASAPPPPPPEPPPPTEPPPIPGAGTPDLQITKRSAGSFTVGVNGTYRITVGNTGTAATTGTITVTDTLPAGLTFVSATGIGWSCSAVGQLVTCRTSASVGVGRSSEDILLTVNPVSAGAGRVTNTATVVSGGPEINTSNNTATDISPLNLPVPTLSEWAMMVLAALLSLAGFAAIRRRRAA